MNCQQIEQEAESEENSIGFRVSRLEKIACHVPRCERCEFYTNKVYVVHEALLCDDCFFKFVKSNYVVRTTNFSNEVIENLNDGILTESKNAVSLILDDDWIKIGHAVNEDGEIVTDRVKDEILEDEDIELIGFRYGDTRKEIPNDWFVHWKKKNEPLEQVEAIRDKEVMKDEDSSANSDVLNWE